MQLVHDIFVLLRKEAILEWRQKYAIGGILLYVLSTVFVVYIAFVRVDAKTWNVLFWIIMLFASINAVVKSFVQENSRRQLYFYTLAHPTAIILSKILYNTLLLGLISILTFAAMSFFTENMVKEVGLFALILFLGSMGFSIAFTFIAAIAAKANNSATLMAIMSFPVVIPILLTLVKLSANALRLITDTSYWRDISILLAIDVILLTLVIILFPYLWRD